MKSTHETGFEIAVVGMAGKFPGASTIDEYWDNLKNGVESISFFTDEELLEQGIPQEWIDHPDYVKAKPILKDIEYFDADFFGYTPREVQVLDIQMRLFHQVAYHGLEHAGYNPGTYPGLVGLYAGASTDINWFSYLLSLGTKGSLETFESSTLANKDMLSQLISYKLNLKGPAQVIYTTCSTSLTAVHVASRALLLGECNMALAGGVTVNLPQKSGYLYEEGMINSKDGHCRAFDDEANGTIFGDGAGVVVLKRLQDAIEDHDTIYAVIKASACNNDGRRKVGLSAPSVEGQSEVIKTVHELAQVDPGTITFLEAHATGTNIGDPIEIAALQRVFHTHKKGFCALGSVKANIGHLHAAAGVASFIKTVLALHHKQLPPQINCDTINKKMDLENSPFYVNRELKDWVNETYPLRAGISSFGIGGTNTHMLLEEAPAQPLGWKERDQGTAHVIPLAAKNSTSLEKLVNQYQYYFENNPTVNLQDVCFTLQHGRKSMGYREAFITWDTREFNAIVNGGIKGRRFSSDGETAKKTVTLYLNLDLNISFEEVYQSFNGFQVFRQCFEQCIGLAKKWMPAVGITGLLKNEDHRLLYTDIISFALEYSLAQTWLSAGVKPDRIIGTGKSEWVAATLSGVFSLEDAIRLVYEQAIQTEQLDPGAMLEVGLPAKELDLIIDHNTFVSIYNSTGATTISGKATLIHQLKTTLDEKGVNNTLLPSNYPLYSKLMEPVVATALINLQDVVPGAPSIPLYSSASGDLANGKHTEDLVYWLSILCRPVQEESIVTHDQRQKNNLILGMGTIKSKLLTALAQGDVIPGLPAGSEEINLFIAKITGYLWSQGADIQWPIASSEKSRRIPLPLYPFAETKIWPFKYPGTPKEEPVPGAAMPFEESIVYTARPPLSTEYQKPQNETEAILVEILEELFGIKPIGTLDDFFELGGHSLLITQAVARVKEIYQVDLELNAVFNTPNVKDVVDFLACEWGGIDKLEEIASTYREYQSMAREMQEA